MEKENEIHNKNKTALVKTESRTEDVNTDPTWSKHPLLSTVIWFLGGYPDPLQPSSNSAGAISQGSHGSNSSLRDSREGTPSWGSKDNLRIKDGEHVANTDPIHLKPKVMKIHGERESTELKDFVVEEGSPSCSPSWGWYVTDSTGNTPQSGAALASR